MTTRTLAASTNLPLGLRAVQVVRPWLSTTYGHAPVVCHRERSYRALARSGSGKRRDNIGPVSGWLGWPDR